jgi:hypothetical protein
MEKLLLEIQKICVRGSSRGCPSKLLLSAVVKARRKKLEFLES